MKVLEGRDVDLIEPFPAARIPAVVGWMHCFKTLIFGDNYPVSDADIASFVGHLLSQSNIRSWGVIDKNNLTGAEAATPLIGFGYFEYFGDSNGYFHVASNRKAWGDKIAQPALMEQAANVLIPELFASSPQLDRISSSIVANNKAAISLAKRVGFIKDGYFRDAIVVKSKPRDVMHFGILRREYGQSV